MDDEDVVRKQLLEDNAYFKKVLNLIPTQFYFSEDARQKVKAHAETTKTNKAKKHSSVEAADGIKPKWKKHDPSQIKSVTELQEFLIEVEEGDKSKPGASKEKKSKNTTTMANGLVDTRDELRKKLHEHLSQLKAKRNALGKDDFMEKKKLKRRESKMKRKLKLKLEKQKGTKDSGQPASDLKNKLKSPAKKPIYNKEGKLVFSKFDLADGGKKKRTNVPTGKDYKTLLEKVQKQKDKVERLKQTDERKAKDLVEKLQWNKVIQKAEGVKVKDDPELLKKALKKKEKMKEKRKKAWQEREGNVIEKMKERQDKRKTNLKKRKQARIDKKIAKAKKKGRIIPGF